MNNFSIQIVAGDRVVYLKANMSLRSKDITIPYIDRILNTETKESPTPTLLFSILFKSKPPIYGLFESNGTQIEALFSPIS